MNRLPLSERHGARTVMAATVAALALAAVAGPAAVQAQKGSAASSAGAVGGAIQGYVYLDSNGDGAYSPSESAVAGVPIRLLGPEGADTAATAVNGLYQFTGLGPGTYAVAIDTTALALVLGSADGLDVPGYDALTVSGTTLSGANFALDAAQVGRLAAALAKAVAAVQAALPGGGATTAMTTTAVTAGEGVTVTDGAAAIASAIAAASPATATAATTATASTTTTGAAKGGRQLSDAGTALTTPTTAGGDAVTATMASAVTATLATTATTATTATGGSIEGARAAASSASGGPDAMPGGGLGDLFGPGALAAIAGLLSVLGGVGALRRRK